MTLLFDFTQVMPPVNNTAEIFKALIEETSVSERQFSQNGFRARLTEIREALITEGITLHFATNDFINAYGRKSSYRSHFLLEIDKEAAKRVYDKINVR